MIISLYAGGMTVRDIEHFLASTLGAELSRETISKITDQVCDEVAQWQQRPLDALYPVIFLDAIVVKVRDGQVTNKPFYVAIGVTVHGERDILGIWAGDGGEGAKFWLSVLTEIKNRGVADVLMLVCDGLKGLLDRYGLPFVAYNQGSIVHLECTGAMSFDFSSMSFAKSAVGLLKHKDMMYVRKDSMERMGAAYMANGIVTLAGSRLYTSMADTPEIIDEALNRFEEVFKHVRKTNKGLLP